MKKLLSMMMLSALLLTVPTYADNNEEIALMAEQRAKEDKAEFKINIFINGKELIFRKEENLGMPFIDKNGRTLVPIRKPIEMSGNKVEWDNKTKTATITANVNGKDDKGNLINPKVVTIKVGDAFLTEAYPKNLTPIKPKKIAMDTTAVVKQGRTYIPLRAVMESIGLKVQYNSKTKTVSAFSETGKIWNKDEINRDFPNLIDLIRADTGGGSFDEEGIAYVKERNLGTIIDTIKLDNSYQDKMKLEIGDVGGGRIVKDIALKTPTRDDMLFIKDGKAIFKTDAFLDDFYYYYDSSERYINNPYATYQGDISDIDYMLLYTEDPVATLIENPFKTTNNN